MGSNTCENCEDHTNRINRNSDDIQKIFNMVQGIFWKIAVITGTIMGIGQGVTIIILLQKIKL